MNQFILETIEQGGYLGIFLLMVLENLFPPIPSEIIMGLGGVAVSRGEMEFWPLMAVGTIGSTLGNYVWFLAGHKLGYERLESIANRWGRWLTFDWHDIEKASRFFQRHGQWVVFAMRFSPFLRTMISRPAGLAHMKQWKFLAFTFVGTGVWNVLLVMGGQWLGPYFDESQVLLDWLVGAGIAFGVVVYLWRVVMWKGRSD